MADTTNKTASPVTAPHAESQKERWVKYGANVALTILVAILLAGFLVYIAQRHAWRKDTTAAGAYSLKPQTVRLVETLPQKVKIVGLFSRAMQAQERKVIEDETSNPEVRYQQVADLLQEYQQKSGGKISVEMIDPVTQPGKVDQLFNEVMQKYGNDVNKYKEVLDLYPKALDQITKLSGEETEALKKLPKIEDRDLAQTIGGIDLTVQIFPQILDQIRVGVKKQLELKVPDYKGAVDAIRGGIEGLNDRIDSILKEFKTIASNEKTPKVFKEYIAAAEPRYQAMKKAGDDVLKKAEGLGELKQLDELRRNKTDSIAIMGESDMKVLPLASIYREEDSRMAQAEGKLRKRFAGEQQVTTALFTLTNKTKRKLAFVRASGPPVTLRLPMFGYTGPFAEIAERLRDLDYELLERDFSGSWQMQSMQMRMQGMPLPEEAKDEDLKDAVWVVVNTQADPRAAMRNPEAAQLAPKVADHLKNGGSAMVLVAPRGDAMPFLKDYGIELKPDQVLVHEKIAAAGARGEDLVDDWHREQPVFIANQYGDHMLARPLNSLDGFFFFITPVTTTAANGAKTANLLPIPATPTPWADREVDVIMEGREVKYTPKKDDVEGDTYGPFFAGAASEKDKTRLVVYGAGYFAENRWLRMPDPEIARAQRRLVPRFPGNAELFINSVFWLSNMDTMIAISPSALEVSRIAPISSGTLAFWRIGVLIIGLPALVLLAGTFVWLKRRD